MSAHPCVLHDGVMHIVVKGDVLDLIGLGGMKKWISLCELLQDCFEVVAMY